MEKQFRDVEKKFSHLKKKFNHKRISDQEYRAQLKKLRLRDRKGKFWTIGAQTGQWYCFDGKKWVESEPPTIQEGKAICIHCGFENELEADFCMNCSGNLLGEYVECPTCGGVLEEPDQECPLCDKESKIWEEIAEEIEGPDEEEENIQLVIRSLHLPSFILLWGVLGLVAGLILGAFTGTTDFFQGVVKILPSSFQDLNGKLIGGIIYGFFGGILGFIVLGVVGSLKTLLVNAIFSFIGGIKIHARKKLEE
jgi:hypothetical protein